MPESLILVVDDEASQRQVLAGFLKRRGYEVVQAASLADALGVVSGRTVEMGISERHLRSRLRRLGVTEAARKPAD